jgi:hypothetical protein
MINNQNEEYHRKIRSEFTARKQNNDATNSKFRTITKRTIEESEGF